MKKYEIKNAVLRKDMLLDMKRPKIFILLLGAVLVSLGFFLFSMLPLVTDGVFADGSLMQPRTMIIFFCFILWMMEIAIVFLIPALTAGAISIEKERQTLEVLLTTRMTPWQIITGKYFSTVFLVLMLIIATLPILCSMFLYGGINLWQMIVLLGVLVSTVVFFSSFGIFFSALIKNTVLSVILTYISVFTVLAITFMLTFTGMIGMTIIDALLCDFIYEMYGKSMSNIISGDLFITCLYLNPLATLFDAIGQIFGYSLFDTVAPLYGIKDMSAIFVHFTEKNILLRWFPFFSILLQALVSFLLLRAAAFFLKPVKKKAKKNKVRRRASNGERPSDFAVH